MTNPSALPMAERDLARMLVIMARFKETTPCPNGGCVHCDESDRVWWDTFDRLDERAQMTVELNLVEGLTPFPLRPVAGRIG